MKSFVKKIVVIALCAGLIVGLLFFGVYRLMPPAYENSYCKGLVKQYRALQAADPKQDKIIVYGGSYIVFSVDTVQLEEETGYPAYCMGMYNSLGFTYPMELMEEFISEGDVVVFPFYTFTKDDYGTSLILMALEGEDDMFLDFAKRHPSKLLSSAGSSVYTKLYTYAKGSLMGTLNGPQVDVYDARSFEDQTGRVIYDRPEPTGAAALSAKYEYNIEDIDDSCFEMLNDLNRLCEEKGAKLVITWPPFYGESVTTDQAGLAEYQEYVATNLDAPVISSFESNFTEYDQLFDTTGHLNNSGMEWYTNKLGEDLSTYLE